MGGLRPITTSLIAISMASAAQTQTTAGSAATPQSAASAGQAPVPGEIIVTALKRAQKLSDVPMSITAITGDTLTNRGITNVQDLVKLTPGLSYAEAGNGVPVYSLRGVGFFDTSLGARPTVSIYTDEAPIPFAIESTGASFDLDRVEVLKGPQGTLFGQNSTGGAINYIAAKPKDHFAAGATVSYDNFATADWQGYITGPVTDTLNARLALRTQQGGAWQESYTRDAKLGQRDFTQGRLLLDWRPTEKLKISVNLNGFVDHGQTQAGQFLAFVPEVPSTAAAVPALSAYPVAPKNDRAADWDPTAPLRKNNQFYQTVLRGDYQLTDKITLTSLTSYSHMKIDQQVDIDGTALTNALEDVSGRLSSLSTELRATANLGNLTAIVGGNYSHDKTTESDWFSIPYSTFRQITAPAAPMDSLGAFGQQDFKIKAVFANADYNIGRLITLHGGLRYTQADLNFADCSKAGDVSTSYGLAHIYNIVRSLEGLPPLAPVPPGQCGSLNPDFSLGERSGTFDQHNVSWRAGIDLKPAAHTMIYFNVSRGYKAGSIPVTVTSANIQADPVKQESVLAYELGFKLSAFDRHADITGAIFDYEYNDKQLKGRFISTPNIFGPLEILVNVPKSRVRGAEAQITVYPTRNLTLTAAGTYLDSKVLGTFMNYTILGALTNFGGEAFPYTPKWQASLDAQYKVPISEKFEANFEAGYNYRSSTSAGFGNEPLLKINGYGLLDLQAGIARRDGRWRVSLFGRNVTNTYYWTNVARYFDVARRLTGQPATYGVQFGVKF